MINKARNNGIKKKIAELKTENKYFIERFDFTEEEKARLLKKLT